MNDKEIFTALFDAARQSNSAMGSVSSALVRDGEIIDIATSSGDTGRHAEDLLFEKLTERGIQILPSDVLYVTLVPCGKRTPGGKGEKYGDCTAKVLKTPIKKVIYASPDHQMKFSQERFESAGVSLIQSDDPEITREAGQIFVETLTDESYIQTRGSREL